MSRLVGTGAFVTGGGQGIGEAVARRLVDDGVTRIAIAGRSRASLERVGEDLRALGATVALVELNLLSTQSIAAAAKVAEGELGNIDLLMNCAGVTFRGDLFDTTPETFDAIFQTNVRGNFFLMQALARGMVERRNGVIVNISSMLAHGGLPHLLPYSASKAALNLMTRNIANAVRRSQVRVHAVNLGWTVTPAEHETQTRVHGLPEDWAKIEGARQPFGRLLEARDPAALCAFLASRDAEMMTGTVIDLEQWVSGVLEGNGDAD